MMYKSTIVKSISISPIVMIVECSVTTYRYKMQRGCLLGHPLCSDRLVESYYLKFKS